MRVAAVLVALLALTSLMGMRAHVGDTVGYTRGDRAIICDHQLDGQEATINFYRRSASGLMASVKDDNGARRGCGRSGGGSRIVSTNVCSGNYFNPISRCSGWRHR